VHAISAGAGQFAWSEGKAIERVADGHPQSVLTSAPGQAGASPEQVWLAIQARCVAGIERDLQRPRGELLVAEDVDRLEKVRAADRMMTVAVTRAPLPNPMPDARRASPTSELQSDDGGLVGYEWR
jgi:hypothetical protein